MAQEGVFPIMKDSEGKLFCKEASTGMAIPGTIQGEGKFIGIPSIFVRLAGCNLRCVWTLEDGSISGCDTPHASFDISNGNVMDVNEVEKLVKHNLGKINHVVITGGEPTLQHIPLIKLCKILKEDTGVHISIETNGTYFDKTLSELIDFFSISPKLSNSVVSLDDKDKISHEYAELFPVEPEDNTPRPDIIQKYIDMCRKNPEKDFQLKFVMTGESDIEIIESEVLSKLIGWAPSDIVAMPLGSKRETLIETELKTAEAAIKQGWRFTPRLHINLFGDKEGV
jgi:7-carboxy-7-deazaguanine synthase